MDSVFKELLGKTTLKHTGIYDPPNHSEPPKSNSLAKKVITPAKPASSNRALLRGKGVFKSLGNGEWVKLDMGKSTPIVTCPILWLPSSSSFFLFRIPTQGSCVLLSPGGGWEGGWSKIIGICVPTSKPNVEDAFAVGRLPGGASEGFHVVDVTGTKTYSSHQDGPGPNTQTSCSFVTNSLHLDLHVEGMHGGGNVPRFLESVLGPGKGIMSSELWCQGLKGRAFFCTCVILFLTCFTLALIPSPFFLNSQPWQGISWCFIHLSEF